MVLKLKRIYDGTSKNDGYRILVDRFYPRGLTKQKANYRLWAKDVAPSTELIKWFHENPEKRWKQFKSKYLKELNTKEKKEALYDLIDEIDKHSVVTLLYGSKNEDHNNAIVLLEKIRRMM